MKLLLTPSEWELENKELLLGFNDEMKRKLYMEALTKLLGLKTTGETRCLN